MMLLADRLRRLGRHVARGRAGAAGGQDQRAALDVGEFDQRRFDDRAARRGSRAARGARAWRGGRRARPRCPAPPLSSYTPAEARSETVTTPIGTMEPLLAPSRCSRKRRPSSMRDRRREMRRRGRSVKLRGRWGMEHRRGQMRGPSAARRGGTPARRLDAAQSGAPLDGTRAQTYAAPDAGRSAAQRDAARA